MEEELKLDNLEGPFQPKPFYDSRIPYYCLSPELSYLCTRSRSEFSSPSYLPQAFGTREWWNQPNGHLNNLPSFIGIHTSVHTLGFPQICMPKEAHTLWTPNHLSHSQTGIVKRHFFYVNEIAVSEGSTRITPQQPASLGQVSGTLPPALHLMQM